MLVLGSLLSTAAKTLAAKAASKIGRVVAGKSATAMTAIGGLVGGSRAKAAAGAVVAAGRKVGPLARRVLPGVGAAAAGYAVGRGMGEGEEGRKRRRMNPLNARAARRAIRRIRSVRKMLQRIDRQLPKARGAARGAWRDRHYRPSDITH